MAQTVPRQSTGLPIRGIRVSVLTGPDEGATASSGEILRVGSAEHNDLTLHDPMVSRFHLSLARRADRILVTDHGSTNGTEIGPVLLRSGEVAVDPGSVLRIGGCQVRADDGSVMIAEHGPARLGELRASSPNMRQLFATIRNVAKSAVSVLVLGESGTGKELIARALHEEGARASGPFVTVDCGAIAPTLFASELFGHERGAFTGADRKHIGAFERAHGGTLFLDEVGELSNELQAALLGVLERGVLRRVGGTAEVPVDVRVISATHRDLLAAVNSERFRLDLFYRLAVVRLNVPPLRERPDDIALLIGHFLDEADFVGDRDVLLGEEPLTRFMRYSWPGNIRELRNVVMGTLALGVPVIPISDPASTDPIGASLGKPYRTAKRQVVKAFERRFLTDLLERSRGSVRAGARAAHMDRKYLTELLRKHHLIG